MLKWDLSQTEVQALVLTCQVLALDPVMRYSDLTNLPCRDDTSILLLQDVATQVQLLLLMFPGCDSSPAGMPDALGHLLAHSTT
jgi:hypothetical protein